jgi:hypothetical protein
MCFSRRNERFVRYTLVILLRAVAAVTCAAQTPEQDYRTRARDSFLAVEHASRLPTPQQDQETAWIYRDIWPVLEREMLTAMAFNSAAAPSAVEERSLTPEELATAYERQGGWPLVAEAARVRCRSLLGSHQKLVEPCARRLEKQR